MTTFTCPHCNQPHSVGARFCPVTGETISQLPPNCKQCGRERKAGANFCPYCGGTEFQSGDQIISPASKKIFPLPLIIGIVFLAVLAVSASVYFLFSNWSVIRSDQTSDSVVVSHWLDDDQDQEAAAVPISISTLTASVTPTIEPSASATHTALPTATATNTILPTASATTPPTQTPSPSPTDTPVGHSRNLKDNAELIYIPPGEFLMGSDRKDDPFFWGAEGPMHQVSLEGYWIYRFEVTNSMYQACVAERACPKPGILRFASVAEYYGNPKYDDYPVVNVTYGDAASYCRWSGGRLPTEAEWEKAARGTDGRLFAWGNEPPTGDLANLCDQHCTQEWKVSTINDGYRETAPVGSYPKGASPYGVLDMSGNVWEWVFDWFQGTYYKVSPEKNPLGPASGTQRVIRGGSYYNGIDGVRVVARAYRSPDNFGLSIGFRCAVDAP
jgi:formylglycine-generating enzyme required for sulfatase activity